MTLKTNQTQSKRFSFVKYLSCHLQKKKYQNIDFNH